MHTILRHRSRHWLEYRPASFPSFFRWLVTEPVRGLFETLLTWQEREMQRRSLSTLDNRMLRDMGLSRADVELEANKPFWRS